MPLENVAAAFLGGTDWIFLRGFYDKRVSNPIPDFHANNPSLLMRRRGVEALSLLKITTKIKKDIRHPDADEEREYTRFEA